MVTIYINFPDGPDGFKIIELLVQKKKIVKVLAIYGHDGHLGHVTDFGHLLAW